MSSPSRLLVVLNSSPYQSARARDALDVVLTAAAFEVPVALLFCGDATYQLLRDQEPEAAGHKDLSATLPVLPLYDVQNLYAEQSALEERGISLDQVVLGVEPLPREEVAALFHRFPRILSF